MSHDPEIAALRSEVELLKRKLDRIMRNSGMDDKEIADMEMNDTLDYCAKTLDMKPLQELLKARQNGRAA